MLVVQEIRHDRVRLGFTADQDVKILRRELEAEQPAGSSCPRCGSRKVWVSGSGDRMLCQSCTKEWDVKPPAVPNATYSGPIDLGEPTPDATPNPPEHGSPVG